MDDSSGERRKPGPSPKARTVHPEANWIACDSRRCVSARSSQARSAAIDHILTAARRSLARRAQCDISALIQTAVNLPAALWLRIPTHVTSCGALLVGDCEMWSSVEHKEEEAQGGWRRPPQAHFIAAVRIGFILQYNGIGSTHLMSHIISCV